MPPPKNNTNYFFENERKASFKTWPFGEREACSITKVIQLLGHCGYRKNVENRC